MGVGRTTEERGKMVSVDSVKAKLSALPNQYDGDVESAMMNAYDMGLREDAEDDGLAFWSEVYEQALAATDARS
jgi:hypothetical protein